MNVELLVAALGAISVGVLLTVGAAANAHQLNFTRSAIATAGIDFSVTFLLLMGAIALFKGISLEHLARLPEAPPWSLVGGAFGAVYVVLNVFSIPRIGLATTLVSVVFGQMLASLVVDSLALPGIAPQEVQGDRLVGVLLLFVAVVLTQRR